MNSHAVKTDILKLENQYWQAMKDNDVETAVSLTRFPCVVSSPMGVMTVDQPTYIKMMKGKGQPPKKFSIEDAHIEMLNENTAIIAYQLNADEKKCYDSSTWVRENGKWLCALHSESPDQQ